MYVHRLFAPQIFPNKTRHTPLQSTGCYLVHSAIHKTTVLHSSFKNVHFPYPGWIFLFFCILQDVLIPVYILRLQSIVLKLHTTDAIRNFNPCRLKKDRKKYYKIKKNDSNDGFLEPNLIIKRSLTHYIMLMYFMFHQHRKKSGRTQFERLWIVPFIGLGLVTGITHQ